MCRGEMSGGTKGPWEPMRTAASTWSIGVAVIG
jgi:hypothetical protein